MLAGSVHRMDHLVASRAAYLNRATLRSHSPLGPSHGRVLDQLTERKETASFAASIRPTTKDKGVTRPPYEEVGERI